MIEVMLLLLGGILGFAHAARNWLALRMKEGYRCIPKVFLWRGIRNSVAALFAFGLIIYLGQSGSTAGASGPGPGAQLFGALFLFAIGVGVGNGVSNLFGGTLSFVTKGPHQPSENSDQIPKSRSTKSKPETDNKGQLKK